MHGSSESSETISLIGNIELPKDEVNTSYSLIANKTTHYP